VPRYLTIKDYRVVASLMEVLVYSFFEGEPSGKNKTSCAKIDQETDVFLDGS